MVESNLKTPKDWNKVWEDFINIFKENQANILPQLATIRWPTPI